MFYAVEWWNLFFALYERPVLLCKNYLLELKYFRRFQAPEHSLEKKLLHK